MDSETQEKQKYAIKALESLKKFKVPEGTEAEKQSFVATLAIIGCKLLNQVEKESIAHLFEIIDDSRGGTLDKNEIQQGLQKLKCLLENGKYISEDEIAEMIKNMDIVDE